MESNRILSTQNIKFLLFPLLLIGLTGCLELLPKLRSHQNQQFVDSLTIGMHIDEALRASQEVFGEAALTRTFSQSLLWDDRCGEVWVCYYPESLKQIFERQKNTEKRHLNNSFMTLGRVEDFIGEGYERFVYVIVDARTNLVIGWIGDKSLHLQPDTKE